MKSRYELVAGSYLLVFGCLLVLLGVAALLAHAFPFTGEGRPAVQLPDSGILCMILGASMLAYLRGARRFVLVGLTLGLLVGGYTLAHNFIVDSGDNELSWLTGAPRARSALAVVVLLALTCIALRYAGTSRALSRLTSLVAVGLILFALYGMIGLWSSNPLFPQPGFRATAALSANFAVMLIGLALWALPFAEHERQRIGLASVCIALMGMSATVLGYYLMTYQADEVTLGKLKHGLAITEDRLKQSMDTHRKLLERMAERWQVLNGMPDEQFWLQEALSYLRDVPTFSLLAVVGRDGKPERIEARSATERENLESMLANSNASAWLASSHTGTRLGPILSGGNDGAALIPLSVAIDLPGHSPISLLALLSGEELFRRDSGLPEGTALEVSNAGRTVFSSGVAHPPLQGAMRANLDVEVWPAVVWQLTAYPERWRQPSGFAALAPGSLLLGLIFTLFIVLNHRLASLANDRTVALRERERDVERQRDLLKMILSDQPADQVMAAACEFLEAQIEGARCLIAYGDEGDERIRHCIAPSFLTGFTTGLIGRPLWDFVPDGLASADALKEDRPVECPLFVPDSDISQLVPIRSDGGLVTGFIVLCRERRRGLDTSHGRYLETFAQLVSIALERDRQRRRLSESEQRFKSLFLFNPDPVFALGPEGTFQEMNEAGLTLLGLDQASLRGRSYLPLVVAEDQVRVTARFEAALAGEPQRYQLAAHAPGLRKVMLDVTVLPIKIQNRIVGVFGIAKNVTEQHQMTAALQAALRGEERKSLQLRGLAEVAVAAARMRGIQLLFDYLVVQARQLIGAHQCVISLTRGRAWGQEITAVSLSDKYAQWRDYATPPDGSGIYALVCELNQPMCLTQAALEAHPRWHGFGAHVTEHPPMRGWLAVPLTDYTGENIGLIQLSDKYDGEFDPADLAVAQQFAQIATAAIENNQLVEKVVAAEQDAQSQLDFATAVTDSIADGIVAIDSERRVSFSNPAACRLLGRTQPGLVGVPLATALPGSINLEDLFADRDSDQQVLAVCGERVLGLAASTLDGDGQSRGWVVSLRDLTSERAADQLRRERDQFFELSLDMFCMVDLQGRFLQTNRAFVEVLRYPPDGLDGTLYADLIHPEDRARVADAVLALQRGEKIRGLLIRATDKEGSEHVLELSAALARDLVIYCVARDVTAHRLAQLALENSEMRLRVTLESITDAFYVLDDDWRIVYMNREAGRVLGVDPATMLGTLLWESFPGSLESEIGAQYQRARQTAVAVHFESFYMPFERWFEVHAYPSDEGLAVYFRDITERVRTAEKLHATMVDLKRSNEELNSFAYVASHDLQEPLRKIRVFSERLQAQPSGLDAAGRDYLARISGSAQRMQELISDLLDYSRLSARPRTSQVFHLDSVLDDVCSDLEASIEEKDAVIRRSALPVLMADPVEFRQVLQNLVGNALKFQLPGQRPVVCVGASVDGSRSWTLSVEDNGIGIHPRHAERIFLPFQRLHERKVYSGTGIGLPIVKKIVERYEGEVQLTSELGRGSVFSLRFPASMLVSPAKEGSE